MTSQPHGLKERRRSLRVRITTAVGAAIASLWAFITTIIGVANLPSDASDAWKAVVSAPEYIPFGLAALFIAAFVWSFWPASKSISEPADLPNAPPERPFGEIIFNRIIETGVPSPARSPELAYEEELARQRAAVKAKAQLMHDRLATRGHGILEPGRSAKHDSYLAAMWDTELRGEFYDDYHRSTFPAPAPKRELTLKAVLERIAYESEWAATRDFSSPADHWQQTMWEVPLGKELMRPLASGEIQARGIRSTSEGDEHGHTDIPASFWLHPQLDPHADRLLCEPGYDYVMNLGSELCTTTFASPNRT